MAEATSTADPDPAAIAALKHVGLAGGLTETKVSCAALGDRLDASTQTASRRLQTLESVGYIERDVVGDGQWVRVTDAGEAALRAEYADYRRLFETDVELVLRGAVTGGMGEGATTSPCPATPSSSEHGWATSRSRARSTSISRGERPPARRDGRHRCGADRRVGRRGPHLRRGLVLRRHARHGRRALRGGPRDRPRPHPPRRRPARTDRPRAAPRRRARPRRRRRGRGPRSRHKSGGHPESDDVEESDDENETPRTPSRRRSPDARRRRH